MKRLLIVDDEAPVLQALRRLLQRYFTPQQLSVEVCAEPLLALRRLQQERFDVLICDYRMPGLDGVTLLTLAKELDPRMVRMMLSASAELGTVLAAVNRAGVFRYIPKPWNEAQLLADLHAAMVFDPCASPAVSETGRRLIDALERGGVWVEWGLNGEAKMPEDYLPTRPARL